MARRGRLDAGPFVLRIVVCDLVILQIALRFMPDRQQATSYLLHQGVAEVVRVAERHYPGVLPSQERDAQTLNDLVYDRIEKFIEGLQVSD